MAIIHRDRHLAEWPGFGWPEFWRRWTDWSQESAGWLRTEEFRDRDTLVVRAEIPGLDPEKDIDVSVASGIVTIRARREEKAEHKNKRAYRSEFHYGEFVREFPLPEGSTSEDIKATYSDGILEVRVPAPEDKQESATKVPVTRT